MKGFSIKIETILDNSFVIDEFAETLEEAEQKSIITVEENANIKGVTIIWAEMNLLTVNEDGRIS